MYLFNQVFYKRFMQNHLICGFDNIGFVFILLNSFLIPLFVYIFSFLLYSIDLLSFETLIIISFTILFSLISHGYLIIISKSTFKFYKLRFTIPLLSIKAPIEKVITILPNSTTKERPDCVIIKCERDDWAEMGYSDWVEINYKDKTNTIGGNKNYLKLISTIETSIIKA